MEEEGLKLMELHNVRYYFPIFSSLVLMVIEEIWQAVSSVDLVGITFDRLLINRKKYNRVLNS